MGRQRNSLFAVLGVVLFIGWVAFVIAFYYVIHKPWWDDLSLAPFVLLLDLILALALLSLSGGMGRWILQDLDEAHILERLAIQSALGLGVLAIVVLVLGLVGLATAWLAWAGLVLGLFLLRKNILGWMKDWRALKPAPGKIGRLGKWALVFSLLLIGMNMLRALAPPLKWDSLVYHLQIPAQYAAAEKIFFYPENLYSGFPQLAGMLYTWAIALGSVSTAATFGWAVGLVMFVGVEGFSRRIFGPRTAWLAPAILLSGFSISQAMSWAYVDLWVMFFGLIMLISLTHYCSSRRRAWLILAAVMVGFAIGTKYTAGALLFAGALMLLPLWDRVARREVTPQGSWLKHTFIDWIILGGIAFAVVSPWLLKNLILVENLIYPAPYFTNGFDPWMQTFRIGPNASRSILNDFLLPFEVTFFGIEGAIVAGKLEYGANVGPLMLALIPGLLLGWRHFNPNQKSSLIRLLVACLGTWLIWSVAAHIADELMWPRHYYGVFPAGAILAVGGFEAASSIRLKQVRIRRILGALVALAFGLSLYAEVLSFVDANPLSVLVGKQTKADYITQELGWYGEAIRLVNELPPESQVLFLWEPRTLYCQDVSCYPDGTLSNWWYLQEVHKGSDDIHQALCGKGVSHVLLNDLGLDVFQSMETSYGSEHWNALEDFRGGRLELLSEIGDSYSLYALDCSVVTIND